MPMALPQRPKGLAIGCGWPLQLSRAHQYYVEKLDQILQSRFKSGVHTCLYYTDSCTSLLKNTIALYLYCETKVYGCFLDISNLKAFDQVSHNTLFNILEKRGVPYILLGFLWSMFVILSIQ